MKPNGTVLFLRQNAWAIILVIMGWIVGFALLQAQVNALEKKIARYPSQDFFTLKFQNIDEKLDNLNEKIEEFDN